MATGVVVAIVVGIAFAFAVFGVSGALTGVFQTALYRSAVAGESVGPFSTDDLGGAYRRRRRRWFNPG